MKNIKIIFTIFLLINLFSGEIYSQDWANLNRYKNENEELELPKQNEKRVVFMGNSITEGWSTLYPEFFVNESYINRGISGQTTPQMLVRFRADVINLKPTIVVILAGTNDIAENTGPTTLKIIEGNIISMAEIAKVNGIKVILSSVLPALSFSWNKGINPANEISKLNILIKAYADKNGIPYLDYYSQMANERKGLKNEFTYDGVHPNAAGYEVMSKLVEETITKVLTQK